MFLLPTSASPEGPSFSLELRPSAGWPFSSRLPSASRTAGGETGTVARMVTDSKGRRFRGLGHESYVLPDIDFGRGLHTQISRRARAVVLSQVVALARVAQMETRLTSVRSSGSGRRKHPDIDIRIGGFVGMYTLRGYEVRDWTQGTLSCGSRGNV